MHPPILVSRTRRRRPVALAAARTAAAGLLAASLAGAAAQAPPGVARDCPARATILVEHFIDADCLACWQVAPPGLGAMPVSPREWSLDWIAPAGDDAAMNAGALPEAAERLGRVNAELPARLASAPAAFDNMTALARPPAGHRFYVHSSLPYRGYFGVQMHATGVWPEGSTAWIALVEQIEPGVRGTQVPRRLVRVVEGPLALPTGPGARNAVAPLHGLLWPENAHPENLVAAAWIEDAHGRITQITSDRCRDPK